MLLVIFGYLLQTVQFVFGFEERIPMIEQIVSMTDTEVRYSFVKLLVT